MISPNLILVMTGNSTPSPNGCAASSEFSSTYAAWRAFDANAATYWSTTAAGVAPCWIWYSWGVGNERVVNGYSILARSDAADGSPKDWTFEGYDGSNWVTLATVTGQTGWGNGERRTYAVANSTAYRTYRLSISANNGRATTNIAEIEMFCTTLSPENGATWVSRTPTLEWPPVAGATSYDVYMGTDQGLVEAADESVFVGNQAGRTYSPDELAENTTYYWRVDAKNGGTTEGDVWSFKTGWAYSYGNGNDFSGDGNCVALWRFESGALGTDGSGNGNTLSLSQNPVADTVDFIEGAAAIDFERSTMAQYASRSNSNLSSNFPLKSTYADAVKVSFGCWFRPESLPSGGSNDDYYSLFGKWAPFGGYSMALSLYRGTGSTDAARLLFQKGYNAGAADEFTILPTPLIAGQWYHVGLTYDDATGAVRIRLWDETAHAVTEIVATHSQVISLSTEPVYIAMLQASSGQYTQYDGLIDEGVFFNDILTAEEIDQIRAGYYPSAVPEPGGPPAGPRRNMWMGINF